MTTSSLAKRLALVVIAVLVVAAGGLWWYVRSRDVPKPPADDQTQPGFVEQAEESGLKFRMAFLPGEQGENFKINLYDHGCGVAVGDFDGDGHEDVYFVN